MKNKEKVFGTALTHTLCPVCTTQMDSAILMNTKLTATQASNVEKLNGTNTWSKELCEECKKMKALGFILIGAVEAKTDDVTNPYRSGNIWCVKQEVADKLFAPNPAPTSGISFIDVNVAAQMELPGVNLDA